MRQRLRKVFSVILATAMLATSMPVSMLAEETANAPIEKTTEAPAEKKEDPAPAPATEAPAETQAPAPATEAPKQSETSATEAPKQTEATASSEASASQEENASKQTETSAAPETAQTPSETAVTSSDSQTTPESQTTTSSSEAGSDAKKQADGAEQAQSADAEEKKETESSQKETQAESDKKASSKKNTGKKAPRRAPAAGQTVTYEYTGNDLKEKLAADQGVDADKLEVKKDGAAASLIELGDYAVTYTPDEGDSVTFTVTIIKAKVKSVTWQEGYVYGKTYSGETFDLPTVVCKVNADDAADIACTVTEASNKTIKEVADSPYIAKVVLDDTAHYEFADSVADQLTKTITVGKIQITSVTWQEDYDYDKTYTGSAFDFPTVVCKVNADDASDVACTVTEASNKAIKEVAASPYTVKVALDDTAHYEFANSVADQLTKTITVGKAQVTSVTWQSEEEYQYAKTYTGSEFALPTVVCKVNAEDTTNVACTVAETDGNDIKEISNSPYTVQVTLDDTEHYEFANSVEDQLTKTITVGKIRITSVTWQSEEEYQYTKTYTGSEFALPTVMCKVNAEDTTNVACTVKEAGEKTIQEIDTYTAQVVLSDTDHYEFADSVEDQLTKTITVGKIRITSVTWQSEGQSEEEYQYAKTYDGTEFPLPTVMCKVNSTDDDADAIACTVKEAGGETIKNAAEYTVQVTLNDTGHYEFDTSVTDQQLTTKKITVKPIAIKQIIWDVGDEEKYRYTGEVQHPKATFADKDDIGAEGDTISGTCTLEGDTNAKTVGNYTVSVKTKNLTIDGTDYTVLSDNTNYIYDGTGNLSRDFSIVPAEIEVEWGALPSVYTGAVQEITATYKPIGSDQEIPCTVTPKPSEKTIKDAGDYKVEASIGDTNYSVRAEDRERTFTIAKRKVTVAPAKLSKRFGEHDPELAYTVKDGAGNDSALAIELSQVEQELKQETSAKLIKRAQGEKPGSYSYSLDNADGVTSNYDVTVTNDVPFVIEALDLDTVDEDITSRDGAFSFELDLDTGNEDTSIRKQARVSFKKLPEDTKGINFSEDIDTYITNGDEGISFTGNSRNVKINDADYWTRKDGKTISWQGKLPAGSEISVQIYGSSKADGDTWYPASNPITVTVKQQSVSMAWSSTATATADNHYLAKEDKLKLESNDKGVGEKVEISYKGNHYYEDLNVAGLQPLEDNSAASHNVQTISASILDQLNLKCENATWEFRWDNKAFDVSSIQYENRGENVTIRLPEPGRLTNVTIDGAQSVDFSTSELKEEFTVPVQFSGRSLITTGAAIHVTYTDEAGNEGQGSGSAARSTVSTPITLKITPATNANGYLNGSGGVLLVSGTACSCEPIQVTVNDISESTYATQKDVWTDSNGTWQMTFDMSRLPEDRPFTISAEYMDVNGPGYDMTAQYKAFVCAPIVTSPVFEAMEHISGMAEPDASVSIRIGDQYYPVKSDSFGHFTMNDVPMMFGGEDSFDVIVEDLAGNTQTISYPIPERGDPFQVTSSLAPMGKLFYDADQSSAAAYTATPIRMSELQKGGQAIPMLLGMSYKVGTFTVTAAQGGFVVNAQITVDETAFADPSRDISEGKVYVYSSQPTLEQLRSGSGDVYRYGEVIPAGENDEVWIVTDQEMTILGDAMWDLEVYNFDEIPEQEQAQKTEAYQEYQSYVNFQTYRSTETEALEQKEAV